MIICGGVLVVEVCEPGPTDGPPTVELDVVVVALGIGIGLTAVAEGAIVNETVETLMGLVVLAGPLIGTETGIF